MRSKMKKVAFMGLHFNIALGREHLTDVLARFIILTKGWIIFDHAFHLGCIVLLFERREVYVLHVKWR